MADAGVAMWRKAHLGDLCRMYQPETITKKQMSDGGAYPVYGANGVMGRHNRFNHEGSQLIIGCRGACGTVHVTEPKSWITGNSMVIQPIVGEVDLHYLRYFFSGPADLPSTITGAAQPQITQASLKPIAVPLPPLEEQQRIVAVLDQAFAALDRARALAEANLADAGELFEATKRHFSSLGADQATTARLGEVVSIAAKLVDPKLPAHLDLPHIGAGNMVKGTDELVDIQTAREEGLKSGKFPFAAGVVLYSKIRPYLRKVARPDFDGLCSADVYPLTPSKHIDRDYLFHMLLSEDFTAYAIAGSARAGMPKVNQEHLFAYRFDLPPVEAQRVIARSIDAALASRKQLEKISESKLVQLADLRQASLQKAFAGELT